MIDPTKKEIELARELLVSAPPERLAGTRVYHFAQALADARARCAAWHEAREKMMRDQARRNPDAAGYCNEIADENGAAAFTIRGGDF